MGGLDLLLDFPMLNMSRKKEESQRILQSRKRIGEQESSIESKAKEWDQIVSESYAGILSYS